MMDKMVRRVAARFLYAASVSMPGIPEGAQGWQLYEDAKGAEDVADELSKQVKSEFMILDRALRKVKKDPDVGAKAIAILKPSVTRFKRLQEKYHRVGTMDTAVDEIVYPLFADFVAYTLGRDKAFANRLVGEVWGG